MNKIGAQLIGTSFDPARLGRPRVVKLVEPTVDYVRRVRAQVGDDCLVVVRFWQDQQPLEDPERRASEWWQGHGIDIMAMRAPNVAVEGLNEVGYDPASAALYARLEVARLAILQAASVRSVVGNWGVTWPGALWPIYQPVVDVMQQGDLLGLHQYWYDRVGIDDMRCCGGFRADRPIVVTECGRDQVFGLGKKGWQRTCDSQTYLEDLRLYDTLLARYPNVVGACVFQAGSTDPQWGAFDVAGIWDQVVAQYTPEAALPSVGVPPFRLGPLFDRWLGWPITTHMGEITPTLGGGTTHHLGVDFGCPEGTPILAPYDGMIDVCATGTGAHKDRGNYIWFLDPEQMCDLLVCHLRELPAWKSGDKVRRGEILGYSGASGFALGPHAHMRIAAVRNDPPDFTVEADVDPEGGEVLAEV